MQSSPSLAVQGQWIRVSSTQGTAAADANDYIIYNRTTGFLSYDADANGSGAAVVFAVLDSKPTIAANDFVIYLNRALLARPRCHAAVHICEPPHCPPVNSI